MWFLHKGHNEQYSHKGKKGYTRAIRLWVYRFPKKDRQKLLSEIKRKIGIKKATLYEGLRIAMVRIPSSESAKFLKYIGECPPELESTFSQKWKIVLGR